MDLLDFVLDGDSGSRRSAASSFDGDLRDLVTSKAEQYGVPIGIGLALTDTESGFNTSAKSYKGAAGLMQLMPATARELGVTDPTDPVQNVDGGMRYLRQMYDRFGDWKLAVAAYHAGPAAVARAGGIPDTSDGLMKTRDYANSIISKALQYGDLDAQPQRRSGGIEDSLLDYVLGDKPAKEGERAAPFRFDSSAVDKLQNKPMGLADQIAHSFSKGVAQLGEGVTALLPDAIADDAQAWFKGRREAIETIQRKDPNLGEAFRELDQSEGFWQTAKTIVSNPSLFSDFLISNAAQMLPGLGVAKGASVLGRTAFNLAKGAGAADDVALAAARATADKVAQASAAAGASGFEGLVAGGSVYSEVESKLMEQGLSKEEAQARARDAAAKVGLVTAAMAGVGSGKLLGDVATHNVGSGIKGAVKGIGMPALEEGAQNVFEESTVANATGEQADLGKALATGMLAGAGSAAPFHAAGRLATHADERAAEAARQEELRAEQERQAVINPVDLNSTMQVLDSAQSVDEAINLFSELASRPIEFELGESIETLERGDQIRAVKDSQAFTQFLDQLDPATRSSVVEQLNLIDNEMVEQGVRANTVDALHQTLADAGVVAAAEQERRASMLEGSLEEKAAINQAQQLFASAQWQDFKASQPDNIGAAIASTEATIANTSTPESARAGIAGELLSFAQARGMDTESAVSASQVSEAAQGAVAAMSANTQAGINEASATASAERLLPEHGEVRVVDPSTFAERGLGVEQTGRIGTGYARALQAMGRVLGREIVFFEQVGQSKHLDGFASTNGDTIFLNRASSGAAAFHVVAGHEFFHTMPEDIKTTFIEAIRPEIRPEQYESLKAFVNQGHLDEAGQIEEIAADLFGNRFNETEFFDRVLGNIENPTLAQRVMQYVRHFIDHVIEHFRGVGSFETDQYVENLENVREAAVNALQTYMARRADGSENIAGRAASSYSPEQLSQLVKSKGVAGERARIELARRGLAGDTKDEITRQENANQRLAKAAGKSLFAGWPTVPRKAESAPQELILPNSNPKTGGTGGELEVVTSKTVDADARAKLVQEGRQILSRRRDADIAERQTQAKVEQTERQEPQLEVPEQQVPEQLAASAKVETKFSGKRGKAEKLPEAGKRVRGEEMSTRVPMVKDPAEDVVDDFLVIGVEAMKANPEAFAKNVEAVKTYPGFRAPENADTEQVAEAFIDSMVQNLVWLHDQMPAATRARAKLWYDGARAITDRWTKQYDLGDHQIGGVLAVLSPQKDWYMNVSLAKRVLDTMQKQDFTWSDAMEATAQRIYKKEDYAEDLAEIRGKKLSELDDPFLKAMWVRAYDEAHNSRSYPIISPEGNEVGMAMTAKGEEAKVAWGSLAMIAKAISIIDNGDLRNVSDALGDQHKVRNFYNNIVLPNSGNGHVTIDTHAVAAALLRPLSGESREVKHNFGGKPKGDPNGPANVGAYGAKGTYGLYAEAYRRAAAERNLLPREMQSITWEAVRGLFRPTFKAQESNTAAADEIWNRYKTGELTYEQARQEIVHLAGGITTPSWDGPAVVEDDPQGDSADAGELSESGVSRGSTGADAGGAGSGSAGDVPRRVKPSTDTRFSTARRTLTAEQQAAIERVFGKPPSLKEKAQHFKANWKKATVQGVFDAFAPIKELSQKAYVLARMSKGGDSTLEALMLYGKVFVDSDGFYDVRYRQGDKPAGFANVLSDLQGEHDNFLQWVSALRAEQLKKVGLENLFSKANIAALKSLADGKMADGSSRKEAYARALQRFNEFNDSVLEIAEKSGLIDKGSREFYKDMPYVPFYRLQEEGIAGFNLKSGLVNQAAWKRLKGGTAKLNEDLLANVLQNWSHLITASAKNRAAKVTLDAAVEAGVAMQVPTSTPGKGLVSYREGGKEKTFSVSDPYLVDAISAMEVASLGPWSKPFVAAKTMLTKYVTVNPTFKIRNLIRDSIQSIAVSDLSANPIENVSKGWKLTAKDSEIRARMLASGAMIRFGSMLDGNSSANAKRLIEQGVDPATILDSENKVKEVWGKVQQAFDAYQEFTDRGEQANRAALYQRLRDKGMSHGEASYFARDLMDFSSQGKWAAVRMLSQVVPFMNARLQGLYKLGRAGKEDIRRLGYTLGSVALASIALAALYADDEDFQKREDSDRQNYWWFKLGDTALRIPKPFEIGTLGTIAEMGFEYVFLNTDMDGERFAKNVGKMVLNQLALSPVPQLAAPLLEVYANRDSFTGRPIEGIGMERMRPEDRYSERTSQVARFLGSLGLPDPVMLMSGHYSPLSPVKVDHLVQGYFGWVGTMATTVLDYGIRPMIGAGERPDMQLKDVFIAGNFLETLPSNSSRYVSQMYEQAREIEQAYASYNEAKKLGDRERMREIEEEGLLDKRKDVDQLKREASRINQLMKQVESSKSLSGETKRRMLDKLSAERNRLAKSL